MPWYKDWFNSPYYHILYSHRNELEAEEFIQKLTGYLAPALLAKMLDLACGKGRHSIFLHALGFEVLGVDLSENSISEARKHEKPGLHFQVGDMRNVVENEAFDYVFSLFTSFGYFSDEGNKAMLNATYQNLKPKGTFVLDYLNPEKVKQVLVPYAQIEKQGIQFTIVKKIEDEKVLKTIEIQDGPNQMTYCESVRLISKKELSSWLIETGFSIQNIWGNYQLEPFSETSSDRMIFHLQKNKF